MPRFAFEFLEGGTDTELGLQRNRHAFDRIELIPRYGRTGEPDASVELFGRSYSMPFGIAPIGIDGAMWPGATAILARASQAANIPYLAGLLASADIESVARWAADVAWLQLYPLPGDDHAVTLHLARRAHDAGIHALALTLDVPVRSKRPRDLRNAVSMPFSATPQLAMDAIRRPRWLMSLARHGMPQFPNMAAYAGGLPVQEFIRKELGGGFSWEAIARLREAWQRPLILKGILHPRDAEKALEIGVDGIVVSNHGARQFDAAPASIDMLPAVRAACGDRMTLLLDSGIECGLDILKSIASGADAVLSGRAFMYGLGALGSSGADFVAALLSDEVRLAMGQAGVGNIADARLLEKRHEREWKVLR